MLAKMARILGLVAAVLMLGVGAVSPTTGHADPFPKPQCLGNKIYNNLNQCVPCPSGQYADLQHAACHSCPPGGTPIATGGGCKAPFPCGVNQIHGAGGKCVTCPAGAKADLNTNACSAKDHCLGNTVLDPAGPAGKCKACPQGQHADYNHMQCFTNKD